ncbi:hypothetical protein NONO_c62230 [Nocardia nova SH22a]|uniref:Uncharacterized protein n=1 Tax=Nocardia nova SH22a TaxID=1415166 RepID=W5TPD3_9NOCA|nr:hypothetical protein NONO_c62230 [Nocardia nova SH22a]
MSGHGDQPARRTRLYTFPGGVLEVQEYPGDEPGVGVYLEYRRSCSDARAFGSGETEQTGVVDGGRSGTMQAPGGSRLHNESEPA